jgi:hypothetical protein
VDDVAEIVDDWFAAQPDLQVERRADNGWLSVLHGEQKKTIPVYLELGAHALTIESFFMHAPDDRLDEVYGLLLRRNTRTYTLRFALYATGDLMLVGLLPRHAVTAAELDRTLGQLLAAADDTYWPAIRIGFGEYIEREQAWRSKVGLERNPIS